MPQNFGESLSEILAKNKVGFACLQTKYLGENRYNTGWKLNTMETEVSTNG